MSKDDVAAFENVSVCGATHKALLVMIDNKKYWIPRGAIHEDSEVFNDGENNSGKLVAMQWWAEKEGLV